MASNRFTRIYSQFSGSTVAFTVHENHDGDLQVRIPKSAGLPSQEFWVSERTLDAEYKTLSEGRVDVTRQISNLINSEALAKRCNVLNGDTNANYVKGRKYEVLGKLNCFSGATLTIKRDVDSNGAFSLDLSHTRTLPNLTIVVQGVEVSRGDEKPPVPLFININSTIEYYRSKTQAESATETPTEATTETD